MSLENMTPEELRAYNLGKLLHDSPDVRKEALRLAKRANPKLNLPEVDLEEQLAAQQRATEERIAKMEEQSINERVALRKRERDREIVAAGFKVEDIEAIIVREHCTYETAMKIADMERQLAAPSAGEYSPTPQGTPIEMRPEGDWRKLSGAGLKKQSASIASDMINEFRGKRARPASR